MKIYLKKYFFKFRLHIKDILKERNEKCTWGNWKKKKNKVLVSFERILYLALTLPQEKKLQPAGTL